MVSLRLAVATLLTSTLIAGSARADDAAKEACIDAHVRGQELRLAGQWRAAKEKFLACSAETCPPAVTRECVQFASEIASSIPKLLLVARDPRGKDLVDVRVTADGAPFVEKLAATPIEIDPGEHTLRFEQAGADPVEQRVIVRANDKERRVEVTLRSRAIAAPPPPPDLRRPAPIGAYVATSVTVVGLGTFAGFAIGGKTLESQRADTCGHHCTDAEVAPIHRDYAVADIALGVSVLAAGVAVWLFVSHARSAPARPVAAFAF